MQPTPQDNQLMSKHRVLRLEQQLRLERRAKDGQNETEQPDHSASLSDSITSSTRTEFSVHTPLAMAFADPPAIGALARKISYNPHQNGPDQGVCRGRPAFLARLSPGLGFGFKMSGVEGLSP
jgi:hypothetical protein